MTTPRELQALYAQGVNITAHLRQEFGVSGNTAEIIEVAYDLQAGSYIAALTEGGHAARQAGYTAEIARVIRSLCEPLAILEAGVGEATTLSGVATGLGGNVSAWGFDLSWSRVALGARWLAAQGVAQARLCTGDLLHIPFADSAVDVVYTSHSIEPNGGREAVILRELYRVAGKFLVLLEPGFELAGEEARQRMLAHGYCRDLPATAAALGFEVIAHQLFPFASNPLNPTALTVIRKREGPRPAHVFACPRFKTPLEEVAGGLFSPEGLVVYPVLGGIPCLRIENGILASKARDVCPTR